MRLVVVGYNVKAAKGDDSMFFEAPRTDGLLRGPRTDRTKLMRALGNAPWDLETLLGLHLGLLDHAEDVRIAAMKALQHIAQRKPDPIAISPVALLAYFMHSFTAASGMSLTAFQSFVELNTAESSKVMQAVLEPGQGSNIQFEQWVTILRDANRIELLRNVELAKFSKARRKVIERALAREGNSR